MLSNDTQSNDFIIKREEIKEKIITCNTSHFKKAYSSKIHNNRICKELRKDSIRDRILNGILQKEECDNDNIYEFSKILQ